MQVNFTFTIDDKNDDVNFDLSINERGEEDSLNIEMSKNVGLTLFAISKTGLITQQIYEEIYDKLLGYIEKRPNSEIYIMEILNTLHSCENIQQAISQSPIVKPSAAFE